MQRSQNHFIFFSPRLAALLFLVTLQVAKTLAAGDLTDGSEVVTPAPGWRVTVIAEGLAGVDNLAIDSDGTLYATLELSGRMGKVVRIHNGEAQPVLTGLQRPDGLVARDGILYITEEVPRGRVSLLELNTGRHRVLTHLRMPEGIDLWPDGGLVVAEDVRNGRILRLSLTGELSVIVGGLQRPEGLFVTDDGVIYVAETRSGRILRVNRNGGMTVVVTGLNNPDQVERGPQGGLWITEDAIPGRLLRYHHGRLDTILHGLSAPQGMAFQADDTMLLAEQGRGRILAVERIPR